MSGFKGITMNTAPEAEPHIYAEDDAAIYQSIVGADGVFSIGQQCAATVLSNNKVRVADGVVCIGGHFARIAYGDYVDCEIANGQSGVNRNDIIIGKFVTTGSGGIDTMTCEVKQGVAGTTAADPALTQDDIYQAGKIREFPLYRVKIEGLSIVAVEQLFEVMPTIPQLQAELTKLNSNLVKIFEKEYTMPICPGYGTVYINILDDIKSIVGNEQARIVSASAFAASISEIPFFWYSSDNGIMSYLYVYNTASAQANSAKVRVKIAYI